MTGDTGPMRAAARTALVILLPAGAAVENPPDLWESWAEITGSLGAIADAAKERDGRWMLDREGIAWSIAHCDESGRILRVVSGQGGFVGSNLAQAIQEGDA
jgi:predicted amidohydrolase